MELIQENVEASLELGNEAFSALEQACQSRLKSRTISAEPSSPSEADAYFLPTGSTGTSWAGHDGAVAIYYGGWIFLPLVSGFRAWVDDESGVVLLNATSGLIIGSGDVNVITILGDPPTAYKVPIFYTPGRVIFDRIQAVIQGVNGANFAVQLKFDTDMSNVGTDILTGGVSGQNLSSQTNGQELMGPNIAAANQPSVPQAMWVWCNFSSVTASQVYSTTISISYHKFVA